MHSLVGYENLYPNAEGLPDPSELIRNMSSEVLLKLVADINLALYSNDHTPDTYWIQVSVIEGISKMVGVPLEAKLKSVIADLVEKGISPIFFSSHANLFFYDLLFREFKSGVARKIDKDDLSGFLDAYLTINSSSTKVSYIKAEEVETAKQNSAIAEWLLPYFIHQMDYKSAGDLSAQLVRGMFLFKYLELHPAYSIHMEEFYSFRNVAGYRRMFRNIYLIISKTSIGKRFTDRDSIIDLKHLDLDGVVDMSFIESLCINSSIGGYKIDDDFSEMRRCPLYKWSPYEVVVLSVNFLIDQFYKTQVFALNNFFKTKRLNNFLTDKASGFMERIYLKLLIERCFPGHVKYYSTQCKNSRSEELCDAYLRIGNKVCLIELKDILLSSGAKNNASREHLFTELERKLVENEVGSPKGITQLTNGIKDIIKHGVLFDNTLPDGDIEIYPVILYTDNTFGMDGINRMITRIQSNQLINTPAGRYLVKNVVLSNLNLFEIREKYFARGSVDLFDMLSKYLSHVKDSDYQDTSFEVFSNYFMQDVYHGMEILLPDIFLGVVADILQA